MIDLRKQVADKPVVSVVVPVYNVERFVAAAIESVFAQSFSDWELVIVDDGSKDGSWEIVQKYTIDERVRLLRNDRNLGQFPTHNRGAEAAQGHYIKFLHADDLLYPHCLDVMVALMDAYPAAGMGISSNPSPWCAPKQLSPREVWCQYLLRKSSLMSKGPIGSIFRAEAFHSVGGFDPRFDSSDVKMNLTVGMKYPILILPDGLTWYRTHDAQISADMRAKDTGQKEKIVWLQELLSSPDLPLTEVQRSQAQAAVERDFYFLCRHYLLKKQPQRAYRLWKASGQSLHKAIKPRKPMPANSLERDLPEEAFETNWNVFPGQPALKQGSLRSNSPLVTVIIEASCPEDHVVVSLESVLAQRYQSWEVIIVGQGSGEKLLNLSSDYEERMPIQIIKSGKETDNWTNFNLAARKAQGNYLKFLDGGDLMYPNCLQTMVPMMQSSEAVLGVSGGCGPYRAGIALCPKVSLESELFGTPRFLESPSALIVEKEKFVELGCFEPKFIPAERQLQLKLCQLGPLMLIHTGLVQYRNTVVSPYYGEDHWPLGWAQGYEWIISWLKSTDLEFSKEQIRLATENLLRVAWKKSHRVDNSAEEKKKIIGLAKQSGIDLKDLNETPPFLRKGWTKNMDEKVLNLMNGAPNWESFGLRKK